MKKGKLVRAGVCLVVLALLPIPAGAAGYEVLQLTDNPHGDHPIRPLLSEAGTAACWNAWDGSDREMFLYSGSTIRQITDNDRDDGSTSFFSVNDHGQVAWMGEDGTGWEFFLYDGTGVVQITDSDYSEGYLGFAYGTLRPQINNSGQVLWVGFTGSTLEIVLYDGVEVRVLDTLPGIATVLPWGSPALLNDEGHVAWVGETETGHDVFLYDGVETSRITEGGGGGILPGVFPPTLMDMTNEDRIVWSAVTEENLFFVSYNLFLYADSAFTQITEYTDLVWYTEGPPRSRMTEDGRIFWLRSDETGDRILQADGGATTVLVERGEGEITGWQSNNSGHVLFTTQIDADPEPVREVHLLDGGGERRILEGWDVPSTVQIGDTGLILWGGENVFLAVPETEPSWGPASTSGASPAPGSAVLFTLAWVLIPALFLLRVRMKAR